MTEKRFFQVGSFFIDTVKKEKTKDRNTIIGLLNELTEENQKLKLDLNKVENEKNCDTCIDSGVTGDLACLMTAHAVANHEKRSFVIPKTERTVTVLVDLSVHPDIAFSAKFH